MVDVNTHIVPITFLSFFTLFSFILHWPCVCRIITISPDDESGEKSVSVLLNGEESELTFIDHSTAEMSVSQM